MASRIPEKEGILLVHKPSGMTSHDVVDEVRRALRMRRVGHAGTLDPLAEGLLVILVGRATKLFSRFVGFDKEYIGKLKLGEVTTTGDSEGEVVRREKYDTVGSEEVNSVCARFRGELEQVPPMVSALRVKGKRLYRLARKGVTVRRQPRKIHIHRMQVREIDIPYVEFFVHCSKGTYVRKLAEDIGEALGCGAHIVSIRRLKIGPFSLNDAIALDEINESHLRPFSI
ncbi:MAG: tRNA pseudouridine(55) synthase TruB [Candidatus Omnitrophica bacterium]|nr:tRNA pseudouridine(55) synthase TruB [Candidatus Omnitrophota bacterium]